MGNYILKFWRTYSEIGITSNLSRHTRKHLILSNQINFLLFLPSLVGLVISLTLERSHTVFGILTLCFFFFLIIFLNKRGFFFLSRILLSTVPFFLYLFPIFLYKTADEATFIALPFILIGYTIIPLLLIDYQRERRVWLLVISLCLFFNFFFDHLIIYYLGSTPNTSLLNENYIIYRATHILLWATIVVGYIFLKNINIYYEKRLEVSNKELILRNNQLGTTEEELRQNIEELQTTKELLASQNEELNRIYKKLKSDEKFLVREYKRVKDRDIQIQDKNKELQHKNEELEITLDKLKQTQAQLVQSEKMVSLGVLTAGIAHEINNPINFISSGVTGLKRSAEKIVNLLDSYKKLTNKNFETEIQKIEEFKKKTRFEDMLSATLKVVDNIGTGAHRTTEIVKELRTFSRLDEAELKSVNIHQGIDSVLVLLRNQYKNRIEIVKEYSELPPIECFPGKLNQVFMNVLSNAIQAIENEGTIVITTKKEEENIIISIQDSGTGIPKEIQNRIFEPFFTTKPVGKGTGLGLSITISIIQQNHQGKIKVESSEKGTIFLITLPISQQKNDTIEDGKLLK